MGERPRRSCRCRRAAGRRPAGRTSAAARPATAPRRPGWRRRRRLPGTQERSRSTQAPDAELAALDPREAGQPRRRRLEERALEVHRPEYDTNRTNVREGCPGCAASRVGAQGRTRWRRVGAGGEAGGMTQAAAPVRTPAVSVSGLTKTYGSGDALVRALDDITLDLLRRRVHRDHGPERLGQVDAHARVRRARHRRPRAVVTWSGDHDLGRMNDRQLTALRRDEIGFVFQSYNLVPTLTAAENITLPARDRRPPPRPGVVRRGDRDRRPRRPAHPQAQRALRRSAAAGRGGAGAGQPAAGGVRRRAHRQPRLARRAPRSSTCCAAASTTTGRRS